MNSRKKILFIAAAPKTHKETNWEQEYKELLRTLKRENFRKKYDVTIIPHASAKDVVEFLEPRCWIIHISAHGNHSGDILLESETGDAFVPRRRSLMAVLLGKSKPKCFIFNSCDSMDLAETASGYVDYAIGINGKISNEAAIDFVRHFYQAFADFETIPMAFEMAKNAASFQKLSEVEIDIKYKNSELMNMILHEKQEELQNLQAQSELQREKIASFQSDLKRATEQGKKDIFTRLMDSNPFPKEVFWFVENQEQLASQISEKNFWDKPERERHRFATNLYLTLPSFQHERIIV